MTVEELLDLLNTVPDQYTIWVVSDYGEGELTREMLHISERQKSFVIDTGGEPSLPGTVSIDDWVEGMR